MLNVVECMFMLILDLLVFLWVFMCGWDFEDVNFNDVIYVVVDDLEIVIEEKGV